MHAIRKPKSSRRCKCECKCSTTPPNKLQTSCHVCVCVVWWVRLLPIPRSMKQCRIHFSSSGHGAGSQSHTETTSEKETLSGSGLDRQINALSAAAKDRKADHVQNRQDQRIIPHRQAGKARISQSGIAPPIRCVFFFSLRQKGTPGNLPI